MEKKRNKHLRCVISMGILILFTTDLKAQTWSNAGAGTGKDRWTINDDNTPNHSHLRMQIGGTNPKAWNIYNEFGILKWGFSANQNHNDRGLELMRLDASGDLTLRDIAARTIILSGGLQADGRVDVGSLTTTGNIATSNNLYATGTASVGSLIVEEEINTGRIQSIEELRIESNTEVHGNIGMDNSSLLLRGLEDSNHGLRFAGRQNNFASKSLNGPILFGYSGGALGSTGNREVIALRWWENGNVGIGTADEPTEKLSVAGSVRATNFIGDGSGLINVTASSLPEDYDFSTSGAIEATSLTLSEDLSVSGTVSVGSLSTTGTVSVGSLTTTGSISAAAFSGDGSGLTGVVASLPGDYEFTTTGTINAGNISAGTVSAEGFIGDGSDLTGVIASSVSLPDDYTLNSHNVNADNVSTGRLQVGGSFDSQSNLFSQSAMTVKGGLVITNTEGRSQVGPNIPMQDMTTDDLEHYSLWVEDGIMSEAFWITHPCLWDGDEGDCPDEWGDYVFEDDYQLPSLHQVEEYVKTNKHLPGVPSAGQVMQGYDVHAMNKNFIVKIEELTLYAISQEKKINALREERNGLASKLDQYEAKLRKLDSQLQQISRRLGDFDHTQPSNQH